MSVSLWRYIRGVQFNSIRPLSIGSLKRSTARLNAFVLDVVYFTVKAPPGIDNRVQVPGKENHFDNNFNF